MKTAILLAFATALLASNPQSITRSWKHARFRDACGGTLARRLRSVLGSVLGTNRRGPTRRYVLVEQNGNDDSGRTAGAPMRLEGEIALVVLIRMENNRVDHLRVTSPDCHLDAGGLPFYWLSNVPAAESLAWLKTQPAAPTAKRPSWRSRSIKATPRTRFSTISHRPASPLKCASERRSGWKFARHPRHRHTEAHAHERS